MRRSFDGLHTQVRDHLQMDAFAGHLYLFANKRRDRLNALAMDANPWMRATGPCLSPGNSDLG